VRIHRLLALPAALALTLPATTGCAGQSDRAVWNGDNTAAPAGSSAAAVERAPKELLVATVMPLRQLTYEFTRKDADGDVVQGRVDPGMNSGLVVATAAPVGTVVLKFELLWIGDSTWARVDLGPDGNKQLGIRATKWMKLDLSRLRSPVQSLQIDPHSLTDVLDLPDLLASGPATVRRSDPTHYSGTIDVTAGKGASGFDRETIKKLGETAKSIPFTMVLDDLGRLQKLKVDTGPVDPMQTWELTVTSYGAVETFTEPDWDDLLHTTPDAFYALLNEDVPDETATSET
jgi:hypothetical protein